MEVQDILPTGWMSEAACAKRQMADLHFPDAQVGVVESYSPGLLRTQVLEAKAVCRECPVSHQCLVQAIRRQERHGIWGGLTPEERVKFFKRRTGWSIPTVGQDPRTGQSEKAKNQQEVHVERFA